MTIVEITDLELVQAQSQVALLKTLRGEQLEKRQALQAAGADISAVDSIIADIDEDIAEIEAEARNYDYLLNPRPRPRLCGVCNAHRPIQGLGARNCAECGNPTVDAQPPNGVANWWTVDHDNVKQSIVAPIGEVPE